MKEETNELLQSLLRNRPEGYKHMGLVLLIIDVLVPLLLRLKRNRRFDTRPLEIVLHGFMFGVYGLGFTLFILFFHGFSGPFVCKVSVHFDLFENVLASAILLVFLLVNMNTIGLILSSLSRTLTFRTRAEHLILIASMYYYATMQLDERLATFYYLEIAILTLFSAKKVMECTSSELREQLKFQLRFMEQFYSSLRLLQPIILISHALYQLNYPCSMTPQACYTQMTFGGIYFVLWWLTGRRCFRCKSPQAARSKLD